MYYMVRQMNGKDELIIETNERAGSIITGPDYTTFLVQVNIQREMLECKTDDTDQVYGPYFEYIYRIRPVDPSEIAIVLMRESFWNGNGRTNRILLYMWLPNEKKWVKKVIHEESTEE